MTAGKQAGKKDEGVLGPDPGILFMAIGTRWGRDRRRRSLAWATLLGVILFQGTPVEAGALERAMLGKSAIVDLTHTLGEPVAISEQPRPGISGEAERQSPSGVDPMKELSTRLSTAGLVGNDKRTAAQVPPRELLMSAVVVNIAPKVAESSDYRLTVEDLKSWERQNGRIPRQSAVLLHTGWARRWAEPAQYVNRDAQGVSRVPGFSPAAVAFLVTERQVRGLGVDACVADTHTTATGEAISTRMPPGVWQLENLVNLDRLPAKGSKLVVAPLRIEATIAPARVIAILP